MTSISNVSPHLLPVYPRVDLAFTHGQGPYLFTQNNETYLDFASGIAVNTLGHAHPKLVEALTQQAEKLWHVSNLFKIPQQEALAKTLTEASFADLVFFTNSGAEAVECAIKMARAFHQHQGRSNKTEIITFEGAFHGRTMAALSAAHKANGFGPALPDFIQLPAEDEQKLQQTLSDKTAAIMIEPIQGDGGVRVIEETFLQELRSACDQCGALLIFDEVQVGIGRTGALFAHESCEVAPDILAVAKGLGGGFPIGACLATNRAAAAMKIGTHGSTFGGNPLAMSVGQAVMDIVLEDEFLAHVRRMGLSLTQRLAILAAMFPDVIGTWQGRGLIYGFFCHQGAQAITEAAREQKLLLAPAQNEIVRLLPPLNIEEPHLTEAAEKLEAACATLSKTPQGALVDAINKEPEDLEKPD